MRCKCCIGNIECSWPYHVIEPYISVKAKGDITMADDKSGDVKFSLVTVTAIKVNNLSENKTKDSEIHLKFTNDQEVLQNAQWCNGDIGPIGLEMDQPSRPNSPIECLCTDKCSSSICDKSKNATDNGVNSKFDSEKDQVYPNINCEIPSIFLNNTNGNSNGSTHNLTVEFNSLCNAPNSSTKEENVSGATDEYLSDDCTSSSYYVPSTMSLGLSEDCETFKSPVPPVRPPRTARLRREKTQSEADACLSLASAISYKSLRSQSDPSAHFTTVVKPRALRPSCGAINVSIDGEDLELNAKQAVERQQALQESCGPSSAFKEHSHGVRTEARARTLFYSRSLEISSPHSDEPVFLENGSIVASQLGENANPSRSWAKSMTDVLENSVASSSLCSRKELRPSDCRTIAKQDKDSSQSTSKLCEGKILTCDEENVVPTANGHATNGCNFKEHSEPIHMTLEEVKNNSLCFNGKNQDATVLEQSSPEEETKKSPCRQFFRVYFRPRKSKKCTAVKNKQQAANSEPIYHHRHSFPVTMKAAISSLFGLKRNSNSPTKKKSDSSGKVESGTLEQNVETSNSLLRPSSDNETLDGSEDDSKPSPNTSPFTNRALPPLPVDENGLLHEPTVCVRDDEDSSSLSALSTLSDNYISTHSRTRSMDYAASIEKVKDCGWYWGPISGETAEKLLCNEPDGAFVVRDSSDEHYIFSLTFKLNGWVRHVRIEHDHGNFSFGCQQKFRSNTIVDFIENAVEHSRSGRYLFFLHRRPVLGPMRVQLLHPVSRFKQVQSLQHMCRFVILKSVRRDLIDSLPLPRTLRDYLNTPHYYSEELSHLSSLATAALSVSANAAASSADSSRGDTEAEPS